MNLTRRSLFASAVALLALPRRVAAERLLGPGDAGTTYSNLLGPAGPLTVESIQRAILDLEAYDRDAKQEWDTRQLHVRYMFTYVPPKTFYMDGV